MLIKDTSQKFSRELCPAGTYRAICTSITDMGFHEQNWQGEKARDVRKLRLTFELCDETKEDGSPHYASREVTLSLNEKSALRAILDGWRGQAMTDDDAAKGIDLKSFLGRAAMLGITHKTSQAGNEYAAISSVNALPKGFDQDLPTPTAPLELFDMDSPNWREIYEGFPEWLQNKINPIETAKAAAPADFDDDINF
ncbi:MAG: hypothetical protein HKO06_06675 [Pseudomonadales bacterium]|nr:hypothetical protein [Pseudomonadales bacterium]